VPTVVIWVLVAFQLHSDGIRLIEVDSYKTKRACEAVIERVGELKPYIGAACVAVKIHEA
jgi:hypothetical protein